MISVSTALGASVPTGDQTGERLQRPTKRHDLPKLHSDFERTLVDRMRAEGLSVNTIRQRLYLIRKLPDPAKVTAGDIVDMINGRELSAHSRSAYIAVLRALYSDLVRWDLAPANPMDRIKTPRTARQYPRPLSEDQLEALEGLSGKYERERAFTVLGAYSGLRAGEVGNLPGTALQFRTSGPVLRVHGKGGLEADIPAHPKVVEVMAPFQGLDRPIWDMWPQNVNRSWQRAARSIGIDGVVFHQLRHTFATRLTRAGVDLLVIAEVCRHASVATTQRYAAVATEAPFAAVAGL